MPFGRKLSFKQSARAEESRSSVLEIARTVALARKVTVQRAHAADISLAELDVMVGQRETRMMTRELVQQAASSGQWHLLSGSSSYTWRVIVPLVVVPSVLLAIFISLMFLPCDQVSSTHIGQAEYGEGGMRVCPNENLCAETPVEIFLLAVSRITAFIMYVPLCLVFITMARTSMHGLSLSVIAECVPLERCKDLHYHMGYLYIVEAWLHVTAHIIRYCIRHEAEKLGTTLVGVSGLIAIALLVVILASHTVMRRLKVSYELRCALHWSFFFLVFALMAHAIRLGIVAVVVLLLFLLDKAYTVLFRTYKLESISFKRLDSGEVQLDWSTSRVPGCDYAQSYVNIMVPWINREWHPFSVYQLMDAKSSGDLEAPSGDGEDSQRRFLAERSAVLIVPVGDWTSTLSSLVLRPTRRSGWVQGPFTTPFSLASSYDNTILFATGSGITPALGCIARLGTQRSFFLVWVTRSKAQLRFFAPQLAFAAGCFVYFTGGAGVEDLQRECLGNKLFIKGHRPDIDAIVDTIVLAHEFKRSTRNRSARNRSNINSMTMQPASSRSNCSQDESSIADRASTSASRIHPVELDGVIEDARATDPPKPLATLGKGEHSELSVTTFASLVGEGEGNDGFFAMLNELSIRLSESNAKVAANGEVLPDAHTIVHRLHAGMRKNMRSSWCMLYCGSVKAVEAKVRAAAKRWRFQFGSESFMR